MFRLRSKIWMLALLITMLSVYIPSENAVAQGSQEQVPANEIRFAIVPVGDHPSGYFDDIDIEPGDSMTFEVDLVNASPFEIPFNVYVTNATNGVNGGFLAGKADEDLVGPASWIDFTSRAVVLGPNSAERVSFKVTVPKDTAPGQYIAAMAMDMQESLSIPGTEILTQKLSYAISIGFLVPGELEYSFELGDPEFRAESHSMAIPVTNTGNYLLKPEGDLVILDTNGREVGRSKVQMGSVYGGVTTIISVILPEQLQSTELRVNLELVDPTSGATSSLENEPLVLPEQQDPSSLTLEMATVTPNNEEIVFANVEISLANGGSQLPASNVNLVVLLDGEEVDSFPLATNQVLLSGTNTYTSRYIPQTGWESGTYTFRLEVYSVDPNAGSQALLLDEELDIEIVVP